MGSNGQPLGKWLRRFLAYLGAVIGHTTVLLLGLVSWSVFAVPAWIKPVLSLHYAQILDSWTAWFATARIYGDLAWTVLILSIVIASFLAWNEEREAVDELSHRVNELESDIPKLTAHTAGWWVGRVETQRFGDTLVLLIDLEILNSGAQTSVRQWSGMYRCRDGHREFLSDRMFVEEHLSLGEKRNLVRDDWLLKKGVRRLGSVGFYLASNVNHLDIYQVSVSFQDYLGNVYSVSCPDEEMMRKDEELGMLPWQTSQEKT